jgi:hypothetical protein
MRRLFVLGLSLLLLAAVATATLATRAVPRQMSLTRLGDDALTVPQRAPTAAETLPLATGPSGAPGYWLLAALLLGLAIVLGMSTLRSTPSSPPPRQSAPISLIAGAVLVLVCAALGLWLALVRPAAGTEAGVLPSDSAAVVANWPGRVETGAADTVSVWLTPGEIGEVRGVVRCASASLIPTAGLDATLLTPGGCRPLERAPLEWTWQVSAGQERLYQPQVRIDVVWALADGRSATQTVWSEQLGIQAEQVLVPSNALGALSLAGAGVGTLLTAPLAYRRRRESWIDHEVLVPVQPPTVPVTTSPASPSPPPQPPPDPRETARGAEPAPASASPPPAYLNTQFKGAAPDGTLRVGQTTALFVWVGEQVAKSPAATSRPFAFDFAGAREPLAFEVRVDGDPECWRIEASQPRMVVLPPNITEQAAVFRVTPLKAGADKLYLSVTRADTGAAVQHVWLPVRAEEASLDTSPTPASSPAFAAAAGQNAPAAVRLPLDSDALEPRLVRLTIASGRDAESFTVVVDAELPRERIHQIYPVPVSAAAVQNATLRLRQELEKVVLFAADDAGTPFYPFADPYRLTVEEPLARQAVAPLADAGQQVWHLLFNAPRAPDGLKRIGAALRDLPHGSALQVVIESQQFIVPWALLYDRPGEISAATLDWAGFWGYRFILDVLPPGDYPEPTIDALPPGMWLLFNDDPELRRYAEEQERFVRSDFGASRVETAVGAQAVRDSLRAGAFDTTLLYVFCHGQHESGAARPGALPSESALTFSRGDRVRLADMRRILPGRLPGRPLVFLNACEGATQDAFYYDGFMPFFIEECGARGFIGTEVKAPQRLAHDVALRFMQLFGAGIPVGEALWRLRRLYVDQHNNPLAFNYTLYGLDEVRLARPNFERPV